MSRRNVSFPSESDIVNDTYWLAHKRLAVIHEIYEGHSWTAYNRLKSKITDGRVTVRRKYLADYTVDNFIHIFACSNTQVPIKIAEADRRWLIPTVTEEEERDLEYWMNLNA